MTLHQKSLRALFRARLQLRRSHYMYSVQYVKFFFCLFKEVLFLLKVSCVLLPIGFVYQDIHVEAILGMFM